MTENNAAQPGLNDTIRAVFLGHGFTIKEGQTDLKPYVYEAVHALLSKLRAEGVQAGDERESEHIETLQRMRADYNPSDGPMSELKATALDAAIAALASAPVADERAAQGYGSPADVAQRIEQYLYHDGRKNSATQLLYEAMKALRRPAPAAGDALDRDQQRLALWQAIRDITIGNLHDDKLILANLHKAGYVIALAAIAQQSQLKGDA